MVLEFKDLTLNNGQVAKFSHVDFWSRPNYIIEHKGRQIQVCCTELNGTHLHTVDADWEEPIAPLKHDFQPMPIVELVTLDSGEIVARDKLQSLLESKMNEHGEQLTTEQYDLEAELQGRIDGSIK